MVPLSPAVHGASSGDHHPSEHQHHHLANGPARSPPKHPHHQVSPTQSHAHTNAQGYGLDGAGNHLRSGIQDDDRFSNQSHQNRHPNNVSSPSNGHSPSTHFRPILAHDPHPPDPMDIDSGPNNHDHLHNHAHSNHVRHQPELSGRPQISDTRASRTPLPSNPGVPRPRAHPPPLNLLGPASIAAADSDSVKKPRQADSSTAASLARLLTSSRGRYAAADVLFLHWQDDPQVAEVAAAVKDLAQVLEHQYHYSFRTHAIASPNDGSGGPRSAWRWLSRLVNDFAEDRDRRDVLKVVYYNGYSYLDANRDMVLAR